MQGPPVPEELPEAWLRRWKEDLGDHPPAVLPRPGRVAIPMCRAGKRSPGVTRQTARRRLLDAASPYWLLTGDDRAMFGSSPTARTSGNSLSCARRRERPPSARDARRRAGRGGSSCGRVSRESSDALHGGRVLGVARDGRVHVQRASRTTGIRSSRSSRTDSDGVVGLGTYVASGVGGRAEVAFSSSTSTRARREHPDPRTARRDRGRKGIHRALRRRSCCRTTRR